MEVARQKRLQEFGLFKPDDKLEYEFVKDDSKQEPKVVIDGVVFEKSELIRESSFASMYKFTSHDQKVAVKILDLGLDYINAFYQEVSLWRDLHHPNILKLIKIYDAPRAQYMISEYGCTLRSYIQKTKNKLPLKMVIQLALDLARGLSYLHSMKIIHRNLKCDNLLLDDTCKLKIGDFGVACLETSNPRQMTGPIGTIGYMAPEVLEAKHYDTKADVYSFGICLWEMYCCKPIDNKKFVDVVSAIANKKSRPKIPRQCPKSLAKIMTNCWSADADKRPEMNDVVTSLESIYSSVTLREEKSRNKAGCLCFLQQHGR